jgi:hypothetical protein
LEVGVDEVIHLGLHPKNRTPHTASRNVEIPDEVCPEWKGSVLVANRRVENDVVVCQIDADAELAVLRAESWETRLNLSVREPPEADESHQEHRY